jgi:hypothetical protein
VFEESHSPLAVGLLYFKLESGTMNEATRTNESPVSVEERAWSVECLPTVLDKIREAVLEDTSDRPPAGDDSGKVRFGWIRLPFLNRAPGLSGVLFGQRSETGVRIVAFRPLDSGFAFGRSSTPEEDWQAFEALVTDVPMIGELAALKPAGWFRAHPKNDLLLSKRDLEVFRHFFSEPWQIGLLLRPDRSAPTRARFFLREADGSFCSRTGSREIVVPATPGLPMLRLERLEGNGAMEDSAPPAAPLRETPAIRTARSATSIWGRWVPVIRIWPAALMVVVALVLGHWWTQPAQQAPPPVASTNPPPVKAAADLQKQLDQEAAQLRERVAALEKKWKEEEAQNAQAEQEESRLRKPPKALSKVPAKRAAPLEAGRPLTTARTFTPPPSQDKRRTPQLTPPPIVHSQSPPKAIERPQHSLTAMAAAKPAGTGQAVPGPTAPPNVPAAIPPQKPAPAPQAVPPVTREQKEPSSAALPVGNLAPAQPIAGTPAVPAAVNAAPDNAGRLIWTGRLLKDSTLVIDGRNASIGSLTGELPGKPVRIKVYSGVFTNEGFVLYVPASGAASTVTEAPGRQNGWNKAIFTSSPHRAEGIEVVETPSPKNAWKRLVLRSRNPKLSAIFVDWKLAQ